MLARRPHHSQRAAAGHRLHPLFVTSSFSSGRVVASVDVAHQNGFHVDRELRSRFAFDMLEAPWDRLRRRGTIVHTSAFGVV